MTKDVFFSRKQLLSITLISPILLSFCGNDNTDGILKSKHLENQVGFLENEYPKFLSDSVAFNNLGVPFT